MTRRPSKPAEPISVEEYRRWMEELADQVPSQQAWVQLLLRLRGAARMEELGDQDARLPEGMNAVARVVNALNDFLHSHEIVQAERLAAPLLQLATAIVDLGAGHKPRLFTPIPQGKRGLPKRVAGGNIEAIAARAMDELVEAGVELPDASAKVCKVIRAGNLPDSDKCEPKTVARWRERMKAGVAGKEKVPQGILDRWQAPLPAEAGETAAQRAEWLLNLLRDPRAGRALGWT